MKNNKGITLIALVITIIVLLILAGVSIAMLTGENGILTQATGAADKTAIAEAKEDAALQINEVMSEYYEEKYVDNTTTSTLADYVKANFAAKTDLYTYNSSTGEVTLEADTTVIGTIGTDGAISWNK